MLEPSRKHGHYDRRWQAWSFRSTSTTPNGSRANGFADSVNGAERLQQARVEEGGAIDAWEGEGGSADSLADGLSWETFCETVYPGTKRHYLPASNAWSRYRAGDRSWPQRARRRAPALVTRGGSS
jgi:hypothetical protein